MGIWFALTAQRRFGEGRVGGDGWSDVRREEVLRRQIWVGGRPIGCETSYGRREACVRDVAGSDQRQRVARGRGDGT